MSKQVTTVNKTSVKSYSKIADSVRMLTDDGMVYQFYRPVWQKKWLFSHRLKSENGEAVKNSANTKLPKNVKEKADQKFDEWEYFDGEVEFDVETGNFSMIVQILR